MADILVVALQKIGNTFLEEATSALIGKISDKVKDLKDLPQKMNRIELHLSLMKKFIEDIGIPRPENEVVKVLIVKVRILAHRVEDVIDRYAYHSRKLKEENAMKIFLKSYVSVFSEIATEVTEILKEIENIVQVKNQWFPQSQFSANVHADIERKQREDYLLNVVPDNLLGMDENRMLLTRWLDSNEQSGKVITVCGMGGLGKTTLVRNVYERERNNFSNHVYWIVVSQTYNTVELLRKLLRKIGGPEQTGVADMDPIDLEEKVVQSLKGRRCLIVLDDVWNPEAFTLISNAVKNLQACYVIITTRQEDVAALADPTRQLKMKPLEHPDAFALFCRKAFCNRKDFKCPEELEDLASNMVVRCKGLPLAILSIAGTLSNMPQTKEDWNERYQLLRNELTNNNNVRDILNFSYHDLPGHLRNCFIYCSLFPEDHQFSRETLVRLWVAESFAVRQERSTPEDVADRYLMELIQRNMIEAVNKDELGRVSTCKMHDLIRDLAISVAKVEQFGFANDFGSMENMDEGARRLSLCGWKDKNWRNVQIKLPRLRTLVAVGIIAPPRLLSTVLCGSMYLTAIELQDSEITEVPESIGNLFNLRYIGLRGTNIKSLPESIGKLYNLHTLDIKQTKIEKLPRDIAKIKKLRHLLADRYVDKNHSEFRYFIGMQAPKHLANLDELQTLETVEANDGLAKQLCKLMQLRSLWIDNIRGADCAKLFAALSKMPFLSCLLLSACDENEELRLEALKPESANLRRLIIRGCWAEYRLDYPIFRDHGRNLKFLALSWCNLREDPLQLLAPHVPNLSYLKLNRVGGTSNLVLFAGYFPQLKTLVLERMDAVNQLEIRDGALPQIEGLYVVKLPNLGKIPQGIENLRSLKKLWLLDLHQDFKSQWDVLGMQQKMQYVPELRI